MTRHDPKNPRHMRIFDLLRQGDPAVDPKRHARSASGPCLSFEDEEAVKQSALKSFAKSDVLRRAPEPGRNNKLF
jgi:hypothetical protein